MLHHDDASLHLDEATLTRAVQLALKRDLITLDTWAAQRIHYPTVGPNSRQLWRVSGTIRDVAPGAWSLVIKIFAAPVNQTNATVTSPFYWKREPLAYQSGLLTDLPGGVAAPACFGVTQQPDSDLWLWLEDVQPPHDEPWRLPRFGLAAYQFGSFGGAYLRDPSLLALPWLTHGLIRAWVDDSAWLIDRVQEPGAWGHPLLQQHFPATVLDAVLTLWSEREALFARLDQFPQTLCHQDVARRNLFSRATATGGEETVAIDWEVVGVGAAGEDMGNVLGVSLLNFDVDVQHADELAETLLTQYLAGLGAAGWDGDWRDIADAFNTAAALRCVFSTACWPVAILGDPSGRYVAETEQRWGRSIDDILAAWAAVTRFLLARADAARAPRAS